MGDVRGDAEHGAKSDAQGDILLETTQLAVHHRTARGVVSALDGVDFEVRRGEFVVVRGPSGSGKTTLLLTLGGMLRPSAGSVRLEGTDLYGLPARARRVFRGERVGFVFQTMHLVPYLDCEANVALALPSISAATAREAARGRLQALGLADRAHHRPPQLSAGERQRVALARALVHGPEILLADEPTGNLDPRSAELVARELSAFHASGGTIVLVTHAERMGVVATREFLLEAGKMMEVRAGVAGGSGVAAR